jgi:hypothetical protein
MHAPALSLPRSRRSRSIAVVVQFMLTVALVAVVVGARGGAEASAEQFFLPSADAAVRSALPDTNFVTSTRLRVDGDPISISYLRFDVLGLTGAVESARLRVYPLTPYDSDFQVHALTEPWEPTSVTYSTRPALDDAVIGTSGRVVLGSWMEVDVSALIVGDGTVDLAMTDIHQTGISFASSEYVGLEPTLVVQTADPTSSPNQPAPNASGDPMIAAAGDIACSPASSSFNDLLGTSSACRMG